MTSILHQLNLRVKETPDKLLYVFLDINGNIKESYTYRSFDDRTKRIAHFIHKNYNLQPGDRVLLAYPPGLEIVCAFFACVRLGLIPVPVYPPSNQGFQSSLYKMNFIAKDCEAKAVLTDRTYYWSFKINLSRKRISTFKFKSEYVSKLKWIISNDSNLLEIGEIPESHSAILFLQYTSGSTNNPKGVIVTHDNIFHNCNNVVDHLPIGVSWLPQYHDMGLIGYYIFFAIKGGTTYGFSPLDFIQRPALWLETISKYRATASSAPNFAYEYCLRPQKLPEKLFEELDLSSLKFLMTAAEPVRTNVYNDFLEKFKPYGLDSSSFFSAYGLAEFTLAVTNYGRKIQSLDTKAINKNVVIQSTLKDNEIGDMKYLSCGIPLGDTEVKIVDISSSPKEAKAGTVGEIWLNGSSKCKGYWNRSVLTSEIFEAKLADDPYSRSWLRTGDLGFLYKGELYVCGRVKDMIIIRGLNYYPQDIEVLVEEDANIRKGCVVAFSMENEGLEQLIVVAELKKGKKIPDAHEINTKILHFTGIGAHQIVLIPAGSLPKTSSGKLMRNKTKLLFIDNELKHICEISSDYDHSLTEDPHLSFPGINGHSSIGYRKIHDNLFQKYHLKGIEHYSLGEAGLDSLKLAEFAEDLKALLNDQGFKDLSKEIDLRLVQKIAISELYDILSELFMATPYAKFRFKRAFMNIQQKYRKIEMEIMKKDASTLLNAEYFKSKSTPDSGKYILVTGGTGFFGPFLLKSILEQNNENIIVLVRAQNTNEGMDRLRESFSTIESTSFLTENFEKRVKPICGNLSQPKLGVEEYEWEFLKENIHTIYHNGAFVNYLFDYESMRATNIEGTLEVVKLACIGCNKVLNHISSTFIFGWSVKETLYETDSNEAMELLDFGYSQGKWVSEQIVLNAIKNGLKARIFRPALISPSINGAGYNFDISIRLLAFMLKHGITTSAQNQVSFTPADSAANNIVAISNIEESISKTFHVTRDSYSTLEDVTNILSNLTGVKFEKFSLYDFVPEVVSRCEKGDLLFPLLNFLLRSVDNISTMEFKRYDNSNYQKYRDLSPFGMADEPLEKVVLGILRFLENQHIIQPVNLTQNA